MRNKNILAGALSIISILGVAATTYFCFKESPDAKEALDEEKAKRKEEKHSDKENDEESDDEVKLSIIDTAKIVVPKMKKTAISGGVTVLAIASGQFIHLAVVGGLVASAGLWKDKYDDLDRMLQRECPEVRKKIHDVVSKENLEKKLKEMDDHEKKKTPVDGLKEKAKKLSKIGEGVNEFKVYDDYSKQIFDTTETKILSAKLYMSDHLNAGSDVMYNEVLRRLGGKPVDSFNDIGWSTWNDEQSEAMDLNGNGAAVKMFFETYDGIRHDKKEVLILRFDVDPLKIVYHSGEEGFEEWRESNY